MDFKKLPISTRTVMAYINCDFDLERVCNSLHQKIQDDKQKPDYDGKIFEMRMPKTIMKNPIHQSFMDPPEEKPKRHFRNQVTVKMFIDNKIITCKIFRTGKFHMTGCKTNRQRLEGSALLLQGIMEYSDPDSPNYSLHDPLPEIILEIVMTNLDFELGFHIDQKELDERIQTKCDESMYSVFDPFVQTSVNVKIEYPDPDTKCFEKIIIRGKNDFEIVKTTSCPKAKTKKYRTHTFLIFSSGKVIQSGRYYETEMEPAFNKFVNFIQKNRQRLELNKSLSTH